MLPANEEGDTLGYIAEEPRGFLATFGRQILRTHRPFRALVMDSAGTPILWLRRPFAFINSRMFVQRLKDFNEYTPEGEPVLDTFAEVQQRWHLWRRRYDLFFREDPRRILTVATEPQPQPETELFQQLARVDEGLLAWDLRLRDASGHEFASIRRAFRGFGRELFTDTGDNTLLQCNVVIHHYHRSIFRPIQSYPARVGRYTPSTLCCS